MSYPVPYGYTTQLVTPPRRRTGTAHVVIAWIAALVTVLYLLPWAVAATRGKRNVTAIALINILLGWSAVGWIAALVMACLNDDRPPVLLVQAPYGYQPGYPTPTWTTGAPTPAQTPFPTAGSTATGPLRAEWPVSQPTAPYPAEAWVEAPQDESTQVLERPAPFARS